MTVPVNLLPWREQLRQQRRRTFLLLLLATIALAVCIVLLAAQQQRLIIRAQVASNDLLRNNLALVAASNQEIAHLQQRDRDIAERLAAWQQLQEDRADQVRIFEILVRAVPAEVQLDVLRRRGQSLQIEGIASNHKAVAELLRVLAAQRTSTPSLHRISAVPAGAGDRRAGDVFLLTLDDAESESAARPARSE